ncbi:hypothetical protein PHMEG_0005032 [Phytophthora megakarya]|uniref:Uncharacterized protein n=1 Tax=Phytophthora megakarya TaxID=4795 RepID=A0A225WTV9_9STRA|nr:hypothetical protein PHMEG_0005032 [Phytophthora megakarya]
MATREHLFLKELHKGKGVEAAERFKQQGWDALVANPAYDVLVEYRDTGFRQNCRARPLPFVRTSNM